MRRIVTVALLLVLLTIGGVLYNIRMTQEKPAPVPRAVLLLNGSSKDRTWNEAHVRGMTMAAGRLGVEVMVRENVPEDERSVQVMEDAIKNGARYVFCTSFGFGKWTKEVAERHPELFFFQCTGSQRGRNLATYFGRMYQMRYLAGMVAGMETKTGRIGYVAAFPLAEPMRGINAFTLGVRRVRPDAQVFVRLSHSWNDDAKNEEAARRLLDSRGVDVLTVHCNSLKPLLLAEERGVKTIGCNLANPELLPRSYLTAVVWRWENTYERFLKSALQGSFTPGTFWDGLETGVAGLAELGKNASGSSRQRLESEHYRLQRGVEDVFNGPIWDKSGVLRVPKGDNMSDRYLLEELDWFVEGVVLDD